MCLDLKVDKCKLRIYLDEDFYKELLFNVNYRLSRQMLSYYFGYTLQFFMDLEKANILFHSLVYQFTFMNVQSAKDLLIKFLSGKCLKKDNLNNDVEVGQIVISNNLDKDKVLLNDMTINEFLDYLALFINRDYLSKMEASGYIVAVLQKFKYSKNYIIKFLKKLFENINAIDYEVVVDYVDEKF